jgi:hypothetical protein
MIVITSIFPVRKHQITAITVHGQISGQNSDNMIWSLSWAPWRHFRPPVNCRLENVGVQRGKICRCFGSRNSLLTLDAHISPWAEGPTANMGRGLIWHVIWKMPYHSLFIIYFNAPFLIFLRVDRFQKP